MANVLMAWELGAGLGHLLKLRRVAEELVARGHEVCVASRHPENAQQVFSRLGVTVYQAPYLVGPRPYGLSDVRSMAEILYNVGFGDVDDLRIGVRQWRRLLDDLAPNALYLDHSPTAMLATRGRPIVVACQGNGFLMPPLESPLPPFHQSIPLDDALIEHEATALRNANCIMDNLGGPRLTALADLYRDAGERILTTFTEFDPYAPRMDAEYSGVWSVAVGRTADWPLGGGRKLLVYVSRQAASDRLLTALRQVRYRALVVCPYFENRDIERFRAPHIAFVTHAIDLTQAMKEADLCIAGGATTSEESVLAGTPVLRIPTQKEQYYTALRMQEHGAAMVASPGSSAKEYIQAIERVMRTDRFTQAARSFAERHEGFDAVEQVRRVVERLEGHLPARQAPGMTWRSHAPSPQDDARLVNGISAPLPLSLCDSLSMPDCPVVFPIRAEVRRPIICRVFEGLSNRINAIATAMTTRRPIHLHWLVNDHCPVPFEEVFEPLDGVRIINESGIEYPYSVDGDVFCWFFPKNIGRLPHPVFRERLYAAYRTILGRMKVAAWARPAAPALGLHFRHHQEHAGELPPFLAGVKRAVALLAPASVFLAGDSVEHKMAITTRMRELGVSVVTNDVPLMGHDLDRSADQVSGMCRDLRSLCECRLGVIVNSARSTVADPLRGHGVRAYHTFDDGRFRYGGMDDLFESVAIEGLLRPNGVGRCSSESGAVQSVRVRGGGRDGGG